ncbi:MAG: 7-cyano-7-deazaguanine synthase QueC [Polyangia bacterium]
MQPAAAPLPPGPRKAVVLFSGGLDSTTVLAIARKQGFAPYALSFRYGQRHTGEIEAARAIAARSGVADHVIADIDLRIFGGSALTADVPVPKDRGPDEISGHSGGGIPITYVPARNTIFLSYALAYAEVLGSFDVFLGINALDYSGYPDCRPEYLEAFQRLANLATRAGVEGSSRFTLHAPLLHLSKAEIIRTGLELGVDYGLTRSCYDPSEGGLACGRCDACLLRLAGFAKNGLADPAPYASR